MLEDLSYYNMTPVSDLDSKTAMLFTIVMLLARSKRTILDSMMKNNTKSSDENNNHSNADINLHFTCNIIWRNIV